MEKVGGCGQESSRHGVRRGSFLLSPLRWEQLMDILSTHRAFLKGIIVHCACEDLWNITYYATADP